MKPRLRVISGTLPVRGSFARSTLVVMAATLGSALLGFGREVVNAHYFGTRWELDTFLATATIPTIIFGIFNGALVSALVPTFSEYLTAGEDDEAWRLASTIINGLAILLTISAVLGWLLAPYYVPLIAHGFRPPQMAVAVHMARWLMPSIVATSLAGVVAAMLNAHHRFLAPALQGIAINILTIATTIFFFHRFGIFALVLGTALGLCMQLIVQLPAFLLLGRYRFVLDLQHPGLWRMWSMLGPIVIGSAAGQASIFFDRFFASTLPSGYMSGMNYASKLVFFPQQIFAAAIATVLFPLLASQFAGANRPGLRNSVVTGLRLVNFIMIPAIVGLIVLAYPITQLLFERGEFGKSSTELVSTLIPWASLGVVVISANIVLTRCCFACKRVREAVTISVITVAANIILSVLWLPTLGARGLLLANGVSELLGTAMLFVLVWRMLSGFDVLAILRSLAGTTLATLIMAGALLFIRSLIETPPMALFERAWLLFWQLVIGALVFVALARMLRVEELDLVVSLIMQKFERHLPSTPENRDVPLG
ncbi:MAG: murein biosynthesis integral membrane protein MurJ [Vulcanimicrobiaceae bacterium]